MSSLIRPRSGWINWPEPNTLHIGLLNNMADSALASTERQFFRLFGAALTNQRVCWHFFSLRNVARGETGSLHLIHNNYGSAADLYNTPLDVLIVTGAEPRQSDLRQEAYWSELATVFDWIDREGPPAVFSCLAAHAAILHYDGVERSRLPHKRCGLFDHIVTPQHPYTASLPKRVAVAHSRWNEVPADVLSDAGYEILTYASEAGADLFTKRRRNRLLFLQGHPEYDEDALPREYRRDVRRYLSGASDSYPDRPLYCFTPKETRALVRFRERALRERNERLIDEFPVVYGRRLSQPAPMAPVFGSWLQQIGQPRSRHFLAPPDKEFVEAHVS